MAVNQEEVIRPSLGAMSVENETTKLLNSELDVVSEKAERKPFQTQTFTTIHKGHSENKKVALTMKSKKSKEEEEEEEEMSSQDPEFDEPTWNPSDQQARSGVSPTEDPVFSFMDEVDDKTTLSSVILSTSVYTHQTFPRTPAEVKEQQDRFDRFIRRFDKLCERTAKGENVLIMKPHPLSGFGNNIRSIMTGFYLAVLTDRGMRGRYGLMMMIVLFIYKNLINQFINSNG